MEWKAPSDVPSARAFAKKRAKVAIISIFNPVEYPVRKFPGAPEAACPSLASLEGVDFEDRQVSFLRE
jgi:hypothetical protein